MMTYAQANFKEVINPVNVRLIDVQSVNLLIVRIDLVHDRSIAIEIVFLLPVYMRICPPRLIAFLLSPSSARKVDVVNATKRCLRSLRRSTC